MKFNAIKGLIGAFAPQIGQALGGPLGGAAAQTIAKVLGCEPDERSLTTAIAKRNARAAYRNKKS